MSAITESMEAALRRESIHTLLRRLKSTGDDLHIALVNAALAGERALVRAVPPTVEEVDALERELMRAFDAIDATTKVWSGRAGGAARGPEGTGGR